MIIVHVMEGLGNQMFQYALSCALQKMYPEQIVKLDVMYYNHKQSHTGYSLEKYFDITPLKATVDEFDRIVPVPEKYYFLEDVTGFKKQLFSFAGRVKKRTRRHLQRNVVGDYNFNAYNEAVFHLGEGDWFLRGYWQNSDYYRIFNDEIRNLFPFKRVLTESNSFIADEIRQCESVSVHVRRGDYVGSGHAICNRPYYMKAMRLIEEKVRNPMYYFFSDDTDFVEEQFFDTKNKVVVKNTVEDCDYDMQLMALCKHHIIANSSFSFWGARLSANTNGITIAPKYYLVRGVLHILLKLQIKKDGYL